MLPFKKKQNKAVRAVLKAATEVFAEVGFAGARVDEIASRAGVHQGTMYYHLGDKESLYAVVLHDVFSEATKRISEDVRKVASPEEKLRMYIESTAFIIEQNPHIARIMLWEIASGGRNLPDIVRKDFRRILAIFGKILEEGRREGSFHALDPVILQRSIMGAFVFPMTALRLPGDEDSVRKDRRMNPDGLAEKIEKIVFDGLKRREKRHRTTARSPRSRGRPGSSRFLRTREP